MGRIDHLSEKEAVILELLIGRGEMFGLEIVRASDGRVGQGTLYVTLNRMSDKGYLSSEQEQPAPGAFGPPRRRYRATGLGERAFGMWQEMQEVGARWRAMEPRLV